jgi:hypothetical protein
MGSGCFVRGADGRSTRRPYIGLQTGTGPGGRGPVPSPTLTGSSRVPKAFVASLKQSIEQVEEEES